MTKLSIKPRFLALSVIALGALVWNDAPALASGSATSNLNVSATVTANCTISAGALAFGAYDPVVANASSGSNATGSATLAVACTSGASATITLGQGTSPGNGSTDAAPLRQMMNGSNALAYALYQDTGSTVWGNTAPTGAGYSGTGSSTSVTVYGVVSKGQNVPAGSYADTVVATISF